MTTAIISSDKFLLHHTGYGHPECPERYKAIKTELTKQGLQTQENTLAPQKALPEEILLCHIPEYFLLAQQEISKLRANTCKMLSTGDVVISPDSFEIALLATGGVLTAVDSVMKGDYKNAFCNIRPPGHHARSDRGMGFCLFNNAAIAARYAQKKYGIERVAIIDWDLHHGNGTQEIFYNDPSVFYFSTHQQGIYPGTGFTWETGSCDAIGTKLNCPIQPDLDARLKIFEAFREKLLPAMEQFKPQLVIISAGFDAHEKDPLGSLNLTTEDFGDLTTLVMQIAEKHAQNRLISVLEGGYNLEALAASAATHVKKLSLTLLNH